MSSEDSGPDRDESDDGGQTGGQNDGAGGEPQDVGGQGQAAGQPTAQPQSTGGQGQPAGGQPVGGQAQAQAQGQQGGYQQGGGGGYGESVTDVFSKPATMDQIKQTVAFYALAGVAVGLSAAVFLNRYTFETEVAGQTVESTVGTAALLAVPFVLGPLLALPVGLRLVDALADGESDSQIFATAAAGIVVGNLLYLILFRALIGIELSGEIEFGRLLISGIGGGIAGAIAAVGAGYVVLNDL